MSRNAIPEGHSVLRVVDLPPRGRDVRFAPDADGRRGMATAMGAQAVERLTLTGRIVPEDGADWRLDARLEARVKQTCVVTLEPVTSVVDAPVARRFVTEMPQMPAGEAEMPHDETLEPLGGEIDLAQIATEALALALPDYPRAPGVEPAETAVAPPGVAPLTDADLKPFAGLARLKRQVDGGESG